MEAGRVPAILLSFKTMPSTTNGAEQVTPVQEPEHMLSISEQFHPNVGLEEILVAAMKSQKNGGATRAAVGTGVGAVHSLSLMVCDSVNIAKLGMLPSQSSEG